MKFKVTHSYNKEADTVFRMISDRDYLQKKWSALGGVDIEILVYDKNDDELNIEASRRVPANPPGIVKKFLNPMNAVYQIDRWEISDADVKKGTFDIDIKGVPIRISGTLTIKPTDEGCENDIETDINVRIPLIGNQVAKFVEGDCRKNLNEDYNFSKIYLESFE